MVAAKLYERCGLAQDDQRSGTWMGEMVRGKKWVVSGTSMDALCWAMIPINICTYIIFNIT